MAAWLAAGAAGLGCDDKNEVPPEVLKAQKQPPAPTGPTTRELLEGPKKTLQLAEYPLALDVPPAWNLKSQGAEGDLIMVGGPASSGEIAIQLVQQNNVSMSGGPEAMLAAAKKEVASKPHAINRVELREFGPGKLLEVRTIANPFVNGKLPPEVWGDVPIVEDASKVPAGVKNTTYAILNPHRVKWQFTLFLPAGEKKYNVRGLHFLSLGLHDFERDQKFLEQMMGSLKYVE
jgi:hypothetical protein